MCGGGGGDPGAEARRQEADRQARVSAATMSINNIFDNKVEKTREVANPLKTSAPSGNFLQRPLQQVINAAQPNTVTEKYWVDGDPANSRDKLYANQRNSIYDLNKTDVDRQAAEAERANRFGLARSGLLGGSANIDSVADINRRTNEGLMKVGGIADQAAADLKTADERTRSTLLSMAQSGIDTGTAAQQALKGLEVNSSNAASARSNVTINKLFDDMSQAYLMRQMISAQNGGGQQSQWFGVSNPRQSYGGVTS